MAVPTQLSDLSATAASNSPAASENISTTDDYIRALSSILARISAGTDALVTPVLGTPASGTVTNLTGTASININGTVGATTPTTGAFTTLTTSSTITASGAVTGTRFIPSGSTVPTNGLYLPAANTIGWATNSTLRGVIDSNGTAIVGHSSALSPGAYDPKFQVVGTTYKASSSISRFSNDTGGPHLLLSKSRGVTAGDYTVVQSGDDVGTIRWTAADGTDDVSTVALITVQIDGTPGANDVPGRIIFSTTADGASNATERMRIDSSGNVLVGVTSATSNGGKIETSNGITFPAAWVGCANANTLDDYEEGTWTPSMKDGSGNAATLTSSTGYYTKIGNLVTASGTLVVQRGALAVTNLNLQGLPFTSKNVTATHALNVGYFTGLNSNVVMLAGYLGANATYAYFQKLSAAGAGMSALTYTDIPTASDATFYFTISYLAAS